MKVALFKNTSFDYVSPWHCPPSTGDYVQVSGWVEVDFPALSPEEQMIAKELIALGERQKTFENDFRRQRKDLEAQRESILKKLEKSA